MTWADSQRNGVCGRARESEHSLDAQLCVFEDVDCVSQWFDRWCRFLRAERSTPQSRALPAHDFLCTIAAVGCYAGDDGDYVFVVAASSVAYVECACSWCLIGTMVTTRMNVL